MSLLSQAVCYVEIFDWKDGRASEAHQTPEVMAIREPMGPLQENLEIRALQSL